MLTNKFTIERYCCKVWVEALYSELENNRGSIQSYEGLLLTYSYINTSKGKQSIGFSRDLNTGFPGLTHKAHWPF